jgi:hypothetical protein
MKKRKAITTENKLVNLIMEYWEECAYRDVRSDYEINKLVYDYALSCGIDERKIGNDVSLTVRNMTNSQKRELYKLMAESNIR